MANGHGGKRRGAGRPRKSAEEHWLTGDAGRRGRVLTHPSAPSAAEPDEIEEFDAPNELTVDERHVWMELAPHAFKAGTLRPSTAYAFIVLCRHVLLERQFAQSVTEKGSTKHTAALKEVNKGLDVYGLRANGKPLHGRSQLPVVNEVDAFRKAKSRA